jgi:hypothetical protein
MQLISNNLKFDSAEYRESMGKLYAFVTCIDVHSDGRGKTKKRYWGEVSERNNQDDILQVMMYGGKWDKLP